MDLRAGRELAAFRLEWPGVGLEVVVERRVGVQLRPPAESAHGQVGGPVKHFGKPGMQDRHGAPGQKG